jgi:hypothetical protein
VGPVRHGVWDHSQHGPQPLCESSPLSDLCAARLTIWGALTSLPRAEKATYRYEGSNRYYRGRVLAALRETSEESIPLHEFGALLREDFGDEVLPWLYGIVERVEKDGLVKISATEDRPRAIAEGRAVYGNERPEGPPRATARKPALKMPSPDSVLGYLYVAAPPYDPGNGEVLPGCCSYLPVSVPGSKSSAAELMQ